MSSSAPDTQGQLTVAKLAKGLDTGLVEADVDALEAGGTVRGLDALTATRAAMPGAGFGQRRRDLALRQGAHRPGVDLHIEAGCIDLHQDTGVRKTAVTGNRSKRPATRRDGVAPDAPITAKCDGKAATLVVCHGRSQSIVIRLVVGGVIPAVVICIDRLTASRGAIDGVALALVHVTLKLGLCRLDGRDSFGHVFVGDALSAPGGGHGLFHLGPQLRDHGGDLGVADGFDGAIRTADCDHAVAGDCDGLGHFQLLPLISRGAEGKQSASHELNYTHETKERKNFLKLFFGWRDRLAKTSNAEVTGVPALSARPVDCRVGRQNVTTE